MGSSRIAAVIVVLGCVTAGACSSGGGGKAATTTFRAPADLHGLVLTSHEVPGTTDDHDGPMNRVDLYDEATPKQDALLQATVGTPVDVVSDLTAHEGAPNGGLTITSFVVRCKSPAAAAQLARDGGTDLVRFFGWARATAPHGVTPPKSLGTGAVALRATEAAGIQVDAILWPRASLLEFLMVVDQATNDPARRAATLAARQNALRPD